MQIKVLILHHSIAQPFNIHANPPGWSPWGKAQRELWRMSRVFCGCSGESSVCITVTWLPGSDIPALAAHFTASDDLAAAAAKKG